MWGYSQLSCAHKHGPKFVSLVSTPFKCRCCRYCGSMGMRNFKLTAVSLQNNAHTGPRCDTWVERWNCSIPKSHSFRRTNEYLKTAVWKSHQLIFPYWTITDSTAAYLPGITGLWRHLLLSGQKQEIHQTKKPWARCYTFECSSLNLSFIYLFIYF